MQNSQPLGAPEHVDFIAQRLAETYMHRPRSSAAHGKQKPVDLYSIAAPLGLSQSMNAPAYKRLGSANMSLINPNKPTSVLAEANQEYNGMGHTLFLAVHRSSNLNDVKRLESVIASRIKDSQRPISTTRPMGSATSTIGITSVYEQKAPDSARLFDGAASSSFRSNSNQRQLSASAFETPSRPGSNLSQSGYTKGTVITVSNKAAEELRQQQSHTPMGTDAGDRLRTYSRKAVESRHSSRSSSRRDSRVPSAMRKSTALDLNALATDDVPSTPGHRHADDAAGPSAAGTASPPDASLTTLPYAPYVRPIQKTVTVNRLNDGLRILRETNLRYGLGNMEPNTRPIIANPALTVAGIVQPIQSILTEQMMIASSDLSLRMKELSMSASGINFSKLTERELDSLDTQYVAFGQIIKPPEVDHHPPSRNDQRRDARDLKKGNQRDKDGSEPASAAVSAPSSRQRHRSAIQQVTEANCVRMSDKIKLKKAKDLKQRFPDVCSSSESKMGVKNTINYSTATPLDSSQHLKGYSAVVASQLLSNTMTSAPDLNNNTLQENVMVPSEEPEGPQLPTIPNSTRRDSGFSPIYGFRPPNILPSSSSKARVDLGGQLCS